MNKALFKLFFIIEILDNVRFSITDDLKNIINTNKFAGKMRNKKFKFLL